MFHAGGGLSDILGLSPLAYVWCSHWSYYFCIKLILARSPLAKWQHDRSKLKPMHSWVYIKHELVLLLQLIATGVFELHIPAALFPVPAEVSRYLTTISGSAHDECEPTKTVADPGSANGGVRSSAAGASIEAPKAPRGWGVDRGTPHWERGLWRGQCPLPRNFFRL